MAETGITIATPEQMQDIFDLRWSVLRMPLGEPKGSEQDKYDDLANFPDTIHGIAQRGMRIVATGRINRDEDDPNEAQVRYMATSREFRGRGLGSKVLSHMEEIAKDLPGIQTIRLNARRAAVPLYERAGYERVSGLIRLHNIPHIRMRKSV